jgi:hypothetical protein
MRMVYIDATCPQHDASPWPDDFPRESAGLCTLPSPPPMPPPPGASPVISRFTPLGARSVCDGLACIAQVLYERGACSPTIFIQHMAMGRLYISYGATHIHNTGVRRVSRRRPPTRHGDTAAAPFRSTSNEPWRTHGVHEAGCPWVAPTPRTPCTASLCCPVCTTQQRVPPLCAPITRTDAHPPTRPHDHAARTRRSLRRRRR